MVEEIKRLLSVKVDEDFVLDAKEVAKAQNKSLNAVYTSRKGDCKLDKLTIFDKVAELVEKGLEDDVGLFGSKTRIIETLSETLKKEKLYQLTVREV